MLIDDEGPDAPPDRCVILINESVGHFSPGITIASHDSPAYGTDHATMKHPRSDVPIQALREMLVIRP